MRMLAKDGVGRSKLRASRQRLLVGHSDSLQSIDSRRRERVVKAGVEGPVLRGHRRDGDRLLEGHDEPENVASVK